MMTLLFQALEKLKRQLAEAEAAIEVRKKPPADSGPRDVGEGLVIDEWVKLLPLMYMPVECAKLFMFSFSKVSWVVLFRRSEGRNTWLGNRLKQ